MNPKNITLAGGVTIKARFEDGHEEDLLVRQFKIKQWPLAYPKSDDEFELVAVATGKTRAQIEELTPDSYNQAHKAMLEVNAEGFFPYASRRREKDSAALALLPPELLQKVMGEKFISSMPSPIIPPPRA